MDEEPAQISKYNEASLQIMRLHHKWQRVDYYFNKGDMFRVKFELDRLWDELYSDAHKKGKPYILRDKLLKLKITKSKSAEELYNNLMDRAHFLKMLQQEVGKGAVYVEEDYNDFE